MCRAGAARPKSCAVTFETFCLVNLLISFGELCLTLGVGLGVEGLGTRFVNWGLMGVARSFTAGDVQLICLTISGVMIGLETGIWVDLDYLSFEMLKLMDFDTLLCFETLNSSSFFSHVCTIIRSFPKEMVKHIFLDV